MMKTVIVLLAVIILTLCFMQVAFAKDVNTVYYYVDSDVGHDSQNDGLSADAPVKTFTRACNLAVRSGADVAYIVIVNDYGISVTVNEVAHTMPFIVTTNDGKVDYAKENNAKLAFKNGARRYYLAGNTTFENVTIEYETTLNIIAEFNNVTMGEGITTVCTLSNPGSSAGVYVVGGMQEPKKTDVATSDSHVTIKSGSYKNVVGGSRMLSGGGSGGIHYKGTHYVSIEGGEIEALYGGTFENHWSNNIDITVSGGHIIDFYASGDETRRAEGNAVIELRGGTVDILNVNNIQGNITVNALGTKIGSMSVSYYNATLADEVKQNTTKVLSYSSLAYTSEEVAAFTGFDTVTNTTYLYASKDGSGDGMSASSPASLADAIAKLSEKDAIILLVGDVDLENFTEPKHTSTVTLSSASNVTVTVNGKYVFGGKTVFDGVALAGEGVLNAENGKVVIGKNCSVSGKFTVVGSADVGAGSFDSITGASDVQVRGGTVKSIVGASENVLVEVFGGEVGAVKSTETECDNFTFTVSGGTVETVTLNNVKNGFRLNIYGGKVGKYLSSGTNARGSAVIYGGAADLGEIAAITDMSNDYVCFISDDASGSGSSVNDPTASLQKAYALLGKTGGTLVVSGKFTVGRLGTLAQHAGKITYTSVYGGVDYAKTNAAEMSFKNNITFSGPTVIENISLCATKDGLYLFANGNELVIGEGVNTYSNVNIRREADIHLSIVGGSPSAQNDKSTNVTVNSGAWYKIYGGDIAGGNENISVNLTVNGGEIYAPVVLGSAGNFKGSINAVFNGGTMYYGIYASELGENDAFDADASLTFNGGAPYAKVGVSKNSLGTYSGRFNVFVNGGEWGHLVELCGGEGLSGSITSSITGNIDFDAKIDGEVTFTNPIRSNGADPWLFYHDGFYYYTATTGDSLGLARAANIGDLKYAEFVTVYKPESGKMWSKNIWSPEIHYYSDEEIGEGNGGWYCYIACDNGDNVYHRMYVIKCLDGDNLFGRWGNPVTGEVNVPQAVIAEDIEDFENTWAAGQTDIRINGKLYMLYVTETGRYRKGDGFYQTENLVEMTNPWTIVGQSSVICRPEYQWEKGGSENGSAPQVVEGGTAVYADDGSIYIIYSGSGYWTTEYQLGQLKYLGGDPLDINNWEKKPTSILYKSDEINGSGHASYVRDHNGETWICYHAYIGSDTSSGRYAFVERYSADENGVVIADGSGHPAPLDTVYTSKINPMPLSEKISGFDGKGVTEIKMTLNSMTAYVNGMTKTLDAAPVIKNSRTMLPVRFVAENLGATVGWDAATQTVSITGADVTIEIVIGATTAKVNGSVIALDSPAYIDVTNNRTYLPVRVVAENLGATVAWDDATKTATLTK